MTTVLTFSSAFVLLGICFATARRAFLSPSSNWIYYALATVVGLYAASGVVVFGGDLPHIDPPLLAGAAMLGWLMVRRVGNRRRALRAVRVNAGR